MKFRHIPTWKVKWNTFVCGKTPARKSKLVSKKGKETQIKVRTTKEEDMQAGIKSKETQL